MDDSDFNDERLEAKHNPSEYIRKLEMIGSNNRSVDFWHLNPEGYYSYLFNDNKSSLNYMRNRVSGTGYKRRLGSFLFKISMYNSGVLNLAPMISKKEINISDETEFDYAIIGQKCTFINRDKMSLIVTGASEVIKREVETLRKVSDYVNTPRLISVGEDMGYYRQEYIDAQSLDFSNWTSIIEGLEMMNDVYDNFSKGYEDTDDVIDDCLNYINSRFDLSENLLNNIRCLVESTDIPGEINKSLIHGDYFHLNVLESSGEIYLVDWGLSRSDYVLVDAYYPFFMYYVENSTIDQFKQIYEKEGEFHERSVSIQERVPQIHTNNDYCNGVAILCLLVVSATHHSDNLSGKALSILESMCDMN